MPRWTVLLLLAMWVDSEPERGTSGLGGESKWRCALRITTDVAVKFLPHLVGADGPVVAKRRGTTVAYQA